MKKTISFGKIDYNNSGRKNCLVTINLELRHTDKGVVFSCCGDIWNPRKSDIYCGGQCLDTIAEYIKTPMFKEIHRLWKLHHLNNMHAGTVEQEAAIEIWEAQGHKYDYSLVCDLLRDLDLYEVEVDGKPYKYGHGWLYRPIPESDLKRITEIINSEEVC